MKNKIISFARRRYVVFAFLCLLLLYAIQIPLLGVGNTLFEHSYEWLKGCFGENSRLTNLVICAVVLLAICMADFRLKNEKDTPGSSSAVFEKKVYGVVLCVFVFLYFKNSFGDVALEESEINSFIRKTSGWLPTWDASDMLGVFKNLLTAAVFFFVYWVLVPMLPAIIPLIIYKVWHYNDVPLRSYEWFAVLVIMPLYLYHIMWVTHHIELYSTSWIAGKWCYWIFSLVALHHTAAERHRCPKCKGSKIRELPDSYDEEMDSEYKGTTEHYSVLKVNGEEVDRKHEKTVDHYEQATVVHIHYSCDRCGHDWWEAKVFRSKFTRTSKH